MKLYEYDPNDAWRIIADMETRYDHGIVKVTYSHMNLWYAHLVDLDGIVSGSHHTYLVINDEIVRQD